MVIGSEGFLGDPAKSRGGEEGEQTTSLCSWGERKEREEGERGGERGRGKGENVKQSQKQEYLSSKCNQRGCTIED